ncbi:hypothetical protein GCM10025868_26740 [Angustibacter aerolatus]|uniref:Uncharacterized protein n=1 Tax=Angustibacter aerolatus TaxID=1162965 RepID=A0ABQ6JJX1_9ACTN|nr:hypothetical protein [Angustibacter aerolatus]GMA87424.1 hypothetical protein GCM10025868_26740 [Angustibacter aerolatus]
MEQSAPADAVPAPGARPHVFGGRRLWGLSYFDQRDNRSRAAALNASALDPAPVAWTPPTRDRQPAHSRGSAVGVPDAVADPWQSQPLGRLPFDPDAAAVVVTYFAGGRFAVYDGRGT